jgi:hypothetical protein
MAGFDEQIVREYFELHGFLVRQVRKYQVQSRKKLAEEEIDLLVYNPSYTVQERKPNFLLFATELPYVHRAVVVVKAWHTTHRFTPSMLKSSSEFFKFLEKNVIKTVEDQFLDDESEGMNESDLLKVLVLPGLPTQEPHRGESIQLLRERGVDGIISFRSMLLDIMQKIEVNRNYSKSDTLQILRILKNYDLVKDPQMGLFPSD